MLHETSYENTYFELANDIIINNPWIILK
jgi:hypothetical protein